jgi:uncharacterized protein (TIGR02453 family)
MSSSFDQRTWSFLDRLADDNTKARFDEERDLYREHVAAPSAAFVDRLADLLRHDVHPALQGEAKVGRSLFRINRDTRFSQDKTPYKTHLDFLFWVGDGPPREQPACIVRLTSTTVLLGAGQMGLKGPALTRYRDRLADPEDGSRIRSVVADLAVDGTELSPPDRANPPRPFPRDHPSAELLRRDGFHLSTTWPHPAEINSDAFAEWCAARLTRFGPLLDWLAVTNP